MNGNHLSWRLTVLLPYLALLVMTLLIRGRDKKQSFHEKVNEFSLETSIVGIGVTAATFGSTEARAVLGDAAVSGLAILMFANLAVTAVVVNVRDWGRLAPKRKKAWLMLSIGALSLAINTYLVGWINGLTWIWSSIYALASWVVALLFLLIFDLGRSRLGSATQHYGSA